MNKNIITDEIVMKLKDDILEIETEAAKELGASRGMTAVQAKGFVNSSAVTKIMDKLDALCEGE